MNAINLLSLIAIVLFLLPVVSSRAQDGNPRHPGVARFEKLASNTASGIVPLSDLNADGIADFALVDNSADPWIYFGVRGGLPEATSGVRLGPTDAATSATRIRAVGDWDGMNGPDICAEIELANDTSFGNPGGYKVFRMVVFWNNGKGEFSLNDTTRLSPGLDASFSALQGTNADLNKDGADDLVLYGGGGLSNGVIIKYPTYHIFKGHVGQRWGRNGIPNTPDWQWWGRILPFPFNPKRLNAEDLDMDGAPDLAFITDDKNLAVLYGSPHALPDTNDVEILDHHGRTVVFSDVSGDGIPDLNVLNQDDNLVRIYIGCKGQRLLEQFGTGHDPPQGEHWWGKPWAAVKGPSHVNSAWLGIGIQLFDLGSGDTNSTEEIWIQSMGYLLCYDVGGQVIEGVRYGLDSLFDGQVYPNGSDAKRLGDIDGDDKVEFSVTNDDGVHIYRMVNQLPTPTPTWWRVPDGCNVSSAVTSDDRDAVRRVLTLNVQAIPNPASGEIRIVWDDKGTENAKATITVQDMLGQQVVTLTVPAYQRQAIWNASQTFGGRYFITLTIGNASETTEILIR